MRSPRFLSEESGATAVEYGLIACLVVLIAIIGVTSLSGSVDSMYTLLKEKLGGAIASAK